MRHLSILFLLVGLCACSTLSPVSPPSPDKPPRVDEAQPSDAVAYLEPPEMLALLEESEVVYTFKDMSELKDPRRSELLDALYPERQPALVLPRLVVQDGEPALAEFPVRAEAGAALREGEAFFRRRDLARAVTQYERALALQPDLYLALSHIGDCALFSGRPAEAIAHYDRAIAINPWDFRTWFYRGNARAALARWDEAGEDFIEALARAPRRDSVLKVLEQHRGRMSFVVHRELFWPKAYARREGLGVAIYLEKDVNAFAAWMAYGVCKAVWLGEPEHRSAVAGRADLAYSSHEDRECFMNLLGMYKAMRQEQHAMAEPQLDRLWTMVEAGHLDSFLVYEFMTRVSPHTVIMSGEQGIARMKDFIRRWVVVKAP